MVQYTWHLSISLDLAYVSQIVFQTHLGQTRVLGRDHGQYKVNYEYTAFQPLVGIFTFEVNDQTVAIGAYEDDCHLTPKRLPFGFEDFNIPSMDEAKGDNSVSSMTWVNVDDGTSTYENEQLDKIQLLEEKEDEVVSEPSQKDNHIVNLDFVEVEVELNINTPKSQAEVLSREPTEKEKIVKLE